MLTFGPPEHVLAAARVGEPVVILDGDGPHAEGDLFVPAALATAPNVAFLVRNGCGYLRAAVTARIARALRIPAMACEGCHLAPAGMPYLVSVDAVDGITTGISASDRGRTLRVLADPSSGPDALARPGHVVVAEAYRARRGGAYGVTEAAVELASAARLPPAGALCGLVSENDETQMATRDELLAFASRHRLHSISSNNIGLYLAGRTIGERTTRDAPENHAIFSISATTSNHGGAYE